MSWTEPGSWREDDRTIRVGMDAPEPERDPWQTVFGVVPEECRTTGRPEIDRNEFERANYNARLGGGPTFGVGGQRLYELTPSRGSFLKQTIGGGS